MAAAATTSPAPAVVWVFAAATCIKLLLVPTYRSTDFDVHRYWLSLTHALPARRWYTDASSQWTLDYPPFFAYFSRLLALPAPLVDASLVSLPVPDAPPSFAYLLYLRLTVAFSDLLLLVSVLLLATDAHRKRRPFLALALVLWSPALLAVDHIHFQYNGFLMGLMLLSLHFLEQGRDLAGGVVFAALLCSKHLFLVAAPLCFVYLFRHYCCGRGLVRGLGRLVLMGAGVAAVFAAAFAPFLYYGQMQQLFNRLFPFGRGLCHAYWAPNFWVFYITLDKILAFLLRRLGFNIQIPEASFTGGLVGDSSPFAVLPKVTPITTFLLVILAMSPCLMKAFSNPQPRHIIRWVSYATTCGFMFGWHVHEKASLHFTIPLALIAMDSWEDAKHYFVLSIVSCYSLFPLLFENQEYPIKVLLLLTYATLMWVGFSSHFAANSAQEGKNVNEPGSISKKNSFVGWISCSYLLGILAIELWSQVFHHYVFGNRFPFLPLMMASIYSGVGMMYSWMWQLAWIARHT
ncbi:probable dolichyl pyrophosphate Glc1Man9GlcNAc2 alpha-1,3-glucosyltransferase [Oryza brachyantha]|uniref:probable dolichyl pyrophosphate Glc1Man9GlcNAc2 alpha-1,3-glucosyltransferase n=1 Tax=Oryza brachyantha TaxID=4533 RepID=UPI001ADB1357|nr:probable dolichyl pyrophosphate Glc1Man9GlcNAc2 alpha-1,3-glucosyltransferase [Oryza brachyantha]